MPNLPSDPFTRFSSGLAANCRCNGAAGSASDCGSGGREIETHLCQPHTFVDAILRLACPHAGILVKDCLPDSIASVDRIAICQMSTKRGQHNQNFTGLQQSSYNLTIKTLQSVAASLTHFHYVSYSTRSATCHTQYT